VAKIGANPPTELTLARSPNFVTILTAPATIADRAGETICSFGEHCVVPLDDDNNVR
jgi:hypothetical protein